MAGWEGGVHCYVVAIEIMASWGGGVHYWYGNLLGGIRILSICVRDSKELDLWGYMRDH